MKQKISVIIPVYNTSRFLDRCVKSVIDQTYNNLEIILVDDGSTDDSAQICDEWAKKDERIVVLHKENGGLSDARNHGIEKARGEFLAFVDSDDYIENNMYEEMLRALLKNDCDISCCGRYYKKGDVITKSRCLEQPRVMTVQEAIHELLINGCVEEAIWDKLYKKELWKDIRFPKNEVNEDLVVLPLVLSKSNRVVHVALPFYYYCYNSMSITKSGYNVRKDVVFKHLNDLDDFIAAKYPHEIHNTDCIKTRYALTTLFAIIQADEENKFKGSYEGYLTILKKAFKRIVFSKNFSSKQKIESFLLITGMYKPIWKFLNKRKKQ